MFRRLMPSRPKISFVCRPEDLGVIAEPRPAKADMPAWFRKIPPVDLEHVRATDSGITVKRCMPFLDALTTGWILPLAATVRLEIKDGGKTVSTVGSSTGRWSAITPASGCGSSPRTEAAVQVPQLLVHPHPAGLELPFRASTQSPQRGFLKRLPGSSTRILTSPTSTFPSFLSAPTACTSSPRHAGRSGLSVPEIDHGHRIRGAGRDRERGAATGAGFSKHPRRRGLVSRGRPGLP